MRDPSFKSAESLTLQPAAHSVASRLFLFAESYDGLNAMQHKIRLSLSRQTTNQLLKNLEGLHIICLTLGEIQIFHIERLRAASA